MRYLLLLVLALSAVSCLNSTNPTAEPTVELPVLTSKIHAQKAPDFRAYWYAGMAELNRYELQQSRYGEMHQGELIAVYVTEDFLADKQVKYDSGDRANVVPILKVNRHRRFSTGVYPYNILTSVFAPIAASSPLKLTFTSTEWCGQAFAQFNQDQNGYRVQTRSYFQDEGDRDFQTGRVVFEDALWGEIRKNPSKLLTGVLQMMPSVAYLRLMHRETRPYDAQASLATNIKFDGWEELVTRYTIEYSEIQRKFSLYFEPEFPHRIVGFEDTYAPLFTPDGSAPTLMTTRAALTNSIMLDYWNQHGNAASGYRSLLGLSNEF